MSLYTIADLHLSHGVDKPMDVFGGVWDGYMDCLRENLRVLGDDDLLIIPGDFSWGINLGEALEDFRFIENLPGRKLLIKGNHDLWWDTVSKMKRFFAENDIQSIDFIHNNCHFYRGAALCGTRGWFYEEERGEAHDQKIMNREVGRLKNSLDMAKNSGAERIYCFMHYPPVYGRYECAGITEMLAEYGVYECFYGHLHAESHKRAFEGTLYGVKYSLVSADYLNFKPFWVMD